MAEGSEYTRFFIGLLALMDPFTNIPVFLAVTAHLEPTGRRRAALVAALTAVVVLVLFQFAGESIIRALGSSLPSFQIAGGLVIGLAGFQMLTAKVSSDPTLDETSVTESAFHVGIVPLGVPLLGGAGAITKVIIESHKEFGIVHPGHITAIIVTVGIIVAVVLLAAAPIGRALGTGGLTVINRIAGLIVIAIAIEMIVVGLASHPSLASSSG